MTTVSRRTTLAVAILLSCGAATARAQVPWESPQLLSPHSPAGVGLHYVDFGLRPLDGAGLLLTYRPTGALARPGFRLAATDPRNDRVRLSAGADFALPLYQRSPTFPLDVVWTSGLGAAYGDFLAIGLPIGVAAGREIVGQRATIAPYTSARVVLEAYVGSDRPDGGFDTALAADLGADLALGAHRALRLRGALSLGDRRGILVGLHLTPGTGR